MSLIPLMKLRLASPGLVVDIGSLRELDSIRQSDDDEGRATLHIGALTTHHEIEASRLVRRAAPLLAEVASSIGDPQVRNRGTIGGALAHSDPSGDWGAAITAMRGRVAMRGVSGEREVGVDEFILDTFATALRDDEILTGVSVQVPPRGSGSSYMKLERKAGDFATVGVAVQLSIDGERCSYAGIGLAALGAKSLRARGAEACLLGERLTRDAISEASRSAREECSPSDDPLRGTAEYKREMAEVFTRRAIEAAASRARLSASGGARGGESEARA